MAKQNFNFNPLSEFKTPESVYDKDRLKKIGGVNALATLLNSLANVYGATKGARVAPQKATNPMLTKLMELSDREDALNYRKSLMALSDSMAEARGERASERGFEKSKSLYDYQLAAKKKYALDPELIEHEKTVADEATQNKIKQYEALYGQKGNLATQKAKIKEKTLSPNKTGFTDDGTFIVGTQNGDEILLQSGKIGEFLHILINKMAEGGYPIPDNIAQMTRPQLQKFIQMYYSVAQEELLDLRKQQYSTDTPEAQKAREEIRSGAVGNIFGGGITQPTKKQNRLPEQKGSLDF
jgi:hypothetical protein